MLDISEPISIKYCPINKVLSYHDATLSFLGLLVVKTRDMCGLNGIALHYSVIFSSNLSIFFNINTTKISKYLYI